MLSYYLKLALHNVRRQRALACLIVLAIAVGIGTSMTMLTVLHSMSSDPLPSRSAQLYHPWLYTRSDAQPNPSAGDQLTYVDAINLLQAKRAPRQAMMARGAVFVQKADETEAPTIISGQYVSADFFAMFGVPMRYGKPWSDADGQAHARVVVLGHELNQRLFGGNDSVGKTLLLGDHLFRVVGIAKPWSPQPKPYVGAGGRPFGGPEQFFLPLRSALDLKLQMEGQLDCWGNGGDRRQGDHCEWLQFWVQLPDTKAAQAYRSYLAAYAEQHRAPGRFDSKGTRTQLFAMMPWLAHMHLVPTNLRLQVWLAQAFLLVCMLNVVGLLLAKFLRSSAEAGIRRAMGATRRDIFMQFTIEGLFMGILGGFLGVLCTLLGLWLLRRQMGPHTQHLAQMDLTMLLAACVLALIATLLAALLPAWRVCRTSPALVVKTS